MNGLRQFIEVIILASSGSAITIWGTLYNHYDFSTFGVLLLVVGTVLFMVRGPRYLSDVVYEASIIPCLRTMNDLLDKVQVKGKSLILPPQGPAHNFRQVLVVGAQGRGEIADALVDEVSGDHSILIQEADGGRILNLVPLGNDLALKIASQFTEEKHQSLEQVFQRVEDILIDMGALSSLEATQDGAVVNVTVEGLASHFSCIDLGKRCSHICSQLLCPICSALACLVCYFAQNSIAVEGISIDGKQTKVSVRIVGGLADGT